MSRIWGLTDGAPDTAPRGRRRRRNAREPRTSLAGELLRLGLAVAIVSVGLGIWTLRVQEVSLRGARLSDRQAARSTAAWSRETVSGAVVSVRGGSGWGLWIVRRGDAGVGPQVVEQQMVQGVAAVPDGEAQPGQRQSVQGEVAEQI